MKWIVSSTTIPRVIASTIESRKPTLPTINPQIPNPSTAGTTLGIKLSKP
ncbi:MAG: hypothetical protein HC897_09735 [Thermoanaerobaculia bacterium]|nr:hypothetical protein [Thermoanaerobaculia bacterium]